MSPLLHLGLRIGVALALALPAAPAGAALILVTTTHDPEPDDPDQGSCPSDDNCTLRRAIQIAADGDEIRFAPVPGVGPILQLASPLRLDLGGPPRAIRILGPGADRLEIRGGFVARGSSLRQSVLLVEGLPAPLDGSGASEIVGVTLSYGGVRGANGDAGIDEGHGESAYGGCIRMDGGALVLDDVAIRNCFTAGGRGADGPDAGPSGGSRDGGKGSRGGSALGGAVYVDQGHLVLRRSSIAEAVAIGGDGGAGGRGRSSLNPINPPGRGGEGGEGGAALGGAVYASSTSTLVIENSTLVSVGIVGGAGGTGGAGGSGSDVHGAQGRGGNGGSASGGIVALGPGGALELLFATLRPMVPVTGAPGFGEPPGDSGPQGPSGIAWAAPSVVRFRNSVVLGAPYGPACSNAASLTTGVNVSGESSCSGFLTGSEADDFASAFHAIERGRAVVVPSATGLLVDRVPTSACTTRLGQPVMRDQSGTTRPQDSDGDGIARCEVGAYELPFGPTLFRDGFEGGAS